MQYQKTELVDAYQVTFTDKEKSDAKMGIPVTTEGSTIRYDFDLSGVPDRVPFSVLIKRIGKAACEGDWIVTDSKGQTTVVSPAEFDKHYQKHEEA